MTSWMYERAKRHMSRNTEAYQSFQLDIGPGAYKKAFLTHRNAVTTAVKRVAGAPCVTEDEKKEVLRADLERNVSLCLQNSFCRNRERSYDLLAKIFRAVPKRSEGELQDVVGEEFLRLNEGNVSEFQKQKASGALPTEFPTIEEKDDLHRILMEVEPLLGASGYRTRRNIVRTHGSILATAWRRRCGTPNAGI